MYSYKVHYIYEAHCNHLHNCTNTMAIFIQITSFKRLKTHTQTLSMINLKLSFKASTQLLGKSVVMHSVVERHTHTYTTCTKNVTEEKLPSINDGKYKCLRLCG